jgi:hypothetical protein
MTLESANLNPYAPPQHSPVSELPVLPPELWSQVRLFAIGVSGRGLVRTVRIGGTVEAEIHYDGWTPPSEHVYVNGFLKGGGNPWDLSLVSPTIEFLIDGPGYAIPARIDAQAGISLWTLFGLRRFRLTIAGQVVHFE